MAFIPVFFKGWVVKCLKLLLMIMMVQKRTVCPPFLSIQIALKVAVALGRCVLELKEMWTWSVLLLVRFCEDQKMVFTPGVEQYKKSDDVV